MNASNKDHLLSTVALFTTAIIWGSGFIATQIAIDSRFSSCLIMLLRFFIASMALLLVFRKKLFPLTRQELKYGLVAGILLFLAFYSQTIGLTMTTPSNNGFLTAINVVMVPFIIWVFYRKRPPLKVFGASALCLFGIFVLTYRPGQGMSFNLGDGLTVLCAFLFACHISYLGHCTSKVDAGKLTFMQMFFAFICSIPVFLIFDLKLIGQTQWVAGIPAILYLGLFSTCLCFFLQTYAQQKASTGKAAVILCTESLWCTFFSVLMGYESLRLVMVLGGLIILASVLWLEVDWKAIVKKQARPQAEGEQ